MVQRQAKGLFFNCDERFTPRHKCMKLLSIQAIWYIEEQSLTESDNDENTSEEDQVMEADLLKLSLQAYIREVTPKTMKI